MKTTKIIGRVISTSPKGVSVNGNPSYYVTFADNEGNVYHGYTASDASCGYGCGNCEYKKSAYIEFHYTRSGNIVIDYILSSDAANG